MLMNNMFLDDKKGFSEDMDFETIQTKIKDLLVEETNSKLSGEMLRHPYK